ncbi:MAG: hypothetical protein V4540_00980 [Pseudomonadota bacterium]
MTSPSVDSDRRVNLSTTALRAAARALQREADDAPCTITKTGRPFRARRAAAGEVDAVYDLHVPPPLAERMMKG